MQSSRPSHPVRRGAAVAVSVIVTAVALLPAAPVRAAEPAAAAGARHLAETEGGSPNDFELLFERGSAIEHSDRTLWTGKYVDERTGEVHVVYLDGAAGTVAGPKLREERSRQATDALPALEAKADAELLAAVADSGASVAAAQSTETVPVGVWLNVDAATAEQAVIARHPELTWDGDRPIVDDLATARAIRAELWQASADARAAALEQVRLDAARLGGTLAYASTSAPLAYLDMPPAAVGALAELPAVATLGLERTWTPAMSTAGPAVQADWTSGGEDQGAGVRVAVVEYHNVRNSGDLAGRVVSSYSTTGSLAFSPGFDHPTWVAGAIAGGGSFPGVAPGAHIVSASTGGGGASVARDRDIIRAADWAASPSGGDADIINASIGQDTATGSEEARRYFDAMADVGGRLPVAAAGNFVTFGNWDIVSPGTAYNTLTVGGIDDRGTADRLDDRVWYVPGSNGSNYRDRTDAAWNPHGDFNKPNVSAPAVSVRTANGLAATGTSVASPIVAGIAAQLIARVPSLALRPEGTRAIIMAGAINRSMMPDGSLNADHEGTGTASALWANRLLTNGDGFWGGHRLGSMTAGQTVTQDISVRAGQRVKVVLSWNSHSTSSTSADQLLADLDLRVVQADGSTAGSFTLDNNYEWFDFTASATGTARLEIRQARFDGSSERYGLAWAKWSVGTPIRIAGADRYATAAAISRAHFNPDPPVAYVATGRNFPDALAAGPVAGLQGGPVLLTDPASLPQATRDELARLRPQRIVVLGGQGAVSDGVAGQLQAYTSRPVERLQGADRYATAAAISHASFGPGVAAAFVATGKTFPDALAAGPAAVRLGGPVLLTDPSSLPAATRNELAYLRPQVIYVLGGAGAVSEAVRNELQAYSTQPVVRLAGADRFATAAAVSASFFHGPTAAYLATGFNFPDALAAVPGAGRSGSPLLLVGGSTIPAPVQGELLRLQPPYTYLVGGPAVVSDAIVGQLSSLLGKQ
ncbi:MAG TPA: cell wall-binding repeat-containing protein [Candidatus Binatia bacterium]|nr:cell wall-binding repeat-containing protein [Candidatus Binatia bacterium]